MGFINKIKNNLKLVKKSKHKKKLKKNIISNVSQILFVTLLLLNLFGNIPYKFDFYSIRWFLQYFSFFIFILDDFVSDILRILTGILVIFNPIISFLQYKNFLTNNNKKAIMNNYLQNWSKNTDNNLLKNIISKYNSYFKVSDILFYLYGSILLLVAAIDILYTLLTGSDEKGGY